MRIAFTLLALVILMAGCAQRRGPAPEPAQAPAAPSAPAAAPTASVAQTLDLYKVEVAQRIYTASSDISQGRPQDLLRAVIVLSIVVNRNGQPVRVSIQRTPGDAEAEQRAIQSVQRGAPYPRPSNTVLRGASGIEFFETWLFNDDGRFQLRSLAQTQAGE